MKNDNSKIEKNNVLNIYNQNYIENIFLKFLKNKLSVKKEWRALFKNIETKIYNKKNDKSIIKKHDIIKLIFTFRSYGHFIAKTNPIKQGTEKKKIFTYFKKKYKVLKKQVFNNIKIKKIESDYIYIYEKMQNIYANSIGIEYMHIDSKKEKIWLKNFLEKNIKKKLSQSKKKNLLKNLIVTNYFEKFLNSKFPGSKRFSIEGSEIIIPIIHEIVEYSKKNSINRVILGMSHRGRINVLRNIFNKSLKKIFSEFDDKSVEIEKYDDVKYHLGYKKTILKYPKKIILEIKNNPSHLESIYPIVLGSARFYLDHNLKKTKNIITILIHGDMSISGQGIVQETLNMSQTKGFKVGGTIHLVINNQIGFTTSHVSEIRSSKYCTDISKIISCPIFHVNADIPEQAIFVINLAINFMQKFNKDVFIDVISYRRNGHHESDDPNVTQPHMYKIIKKHMPVYKIYELELVKEKNITQIEIKKIKKKYNYFLDTQYTKYKNTLLKKITNINNTLKQTDNVNKKSKISFKDFKDLSIKINTISKKIHLHKIVKKIYNNRILMSKEKTNFDWGAAEALAIATLLKEGITCRISGEDVSRGTFFQRHAIIHDQKTKSYYIPLCNINTSANFYIWNSTLSEESVLAFEYGYSISSRNAINIWEAQFGDFANSAQVIIDQFIVSGKKKWGETSSLIMLLPHGYEGQGPEHSSSRLERFLQLSAEKNIQIVLPTNTSQLYHIIRNQIYQKTVVPLIIMSPKSMLRNKKSFKSLHSIYFSNFKNIIYKKQHCYNNIYKIIFCSGKVYYDIQEKIIKKNIKNILIIRIERLYPFPKNDILKILCLCKNAVKFIWLQEEPKNQGAWFFVKNCIENIIPHSFKIKCISRNSSASVSTGYIRIHKEEQEKIIRKTIS